MLGRLFVKSCIEERGNKIWIDDKARYHNSKITTKWFPQFFFLLLLWPALTLDLNLIKNRWQIIENKNKYPKTSNYSLDGIEG